MINNLKWPLAGLIAVSAAVSFSFIYESLWTGFFIAMTVGVILLLIMTWSMFQDLQSTGIKKTVLFLFAGMSILVVYNSVFGWFKSQYQKDTLTEIRQTIDGSIAQMEAEQVLIESLRYKFLNEDVENLEEAFRVVTGERLENDGTLLATEASRGEDLNYSGEIVTQDSIIIKIVADIAAGDDPEFTNIDGKVGKYEGMATLTPNGVHYVRQN